MEVAEASVENFEATLPALKKEPLATEFDWPEDAVRERIVLLAPGGPLVVDAWITVAGRPHREALDEIVDAAIAAGDTNGDGRTTWKEWRGNLDFFTQFVPNQAPTRRQLEMWEETYDRNRDRRIQRREMTAWLGRDAGRSASALNLRSRRTRSAADGVDSRLWDLLDADASGGLSLDEINRAATTLWSLDADDDRSLVDAELTPLEQQLANNSPTSMRTSRIAQRHAALHLDSHFDPGRLSYLLADMYSPRQSIIADSFGALPGLFDELDDGDGWLGDADFARLTAIEPHVRLALSFSDESERLPVFEQVQLSPRATDLSIAARPSGSRLVLALGTSRLVFSLHDLAGVEDATENLRRSQTQLMVHDQCDAVFEYVDTNSDGRLGEREVNTVGARLLKCDANRDGEVFGDELPYTSIVAFLRGENPGATNFYVPDSAPAPRLSSDAPAWFAAADFNSDGDLSRREFLGPTEAFADLDTNADGYIDAMEAASAEMLP